MCVFEYMYVYMLGVYILNNISQKLLYIWSIWFISYVFDVSDFSLFLFQVHVALAWGNINLFDLNSHFQWDKK